MSPATSAPRGILGGQADVLEGVKGMWNELTVNVNAMANRLNNPGERHYQCHYRRRPRETSPRKSRPSAEERSLS